MAKVYERINWEDLPSKNTPINAENLNKMDKAIDDLDDKIVELEESSGEGDYLEKENPVGTGSFSMNRKANTTVGNCSHAEGYDTTASGLYSHAEGYETIASGNCSHAEGEGTIASGTYQHVQGKYNVEDTKNEFAHIVGGGTSDTERKNIHTLDWLGNAVFAGDVINGNGVTMDGLKALIEELSTQVQTLTARLDVLQTTS